MPQPVDLQTEVARVTAAERIQAIADRASLAAQQRAAAEVQDLRIQEEQQVVETPEAQSEHIDAEARRRNPYAGRRRRKKDDESEEEDAKTFYNVGETEQVADEGEGQQLDVTV